MIVGKFKLGSANFANSFDKLKTIMDLKEAILEAKKHGIDTIFGYAVLKSIRDNQPADQILKTIQDQHKDNSHSVLECLGYNEQLLAKVLSFKL